MGVGVGVGMSMGMGNSYLSLGSCVLLGEPM